MVVDTGNGGAGRERVSCPWCLSRIGQGESRLSATAQEILGPEGPENYARGGRKRWPRNQDAPSP